MWVNMWENFCPNFANQSHGIGLHRQLVWDLCPPHQFLYKYLVALVCLDRNLFYCDNLDFVEIGDGTLKL